MNKTFSLILDIQAAQSVAHGGRGIGRYTLSQAQTLLRQTGAVKKLFLNPDLPFPTGLRQDLADFPGLEWNTKGAFQKACDTQERLFYYIMSPFELAPVPETVIPPYVLQSGMPIIVTLYDLIPFGMPERYLSDSSVAVRYYQRLNLIKQADLILAISRSTVNVAVRDLGIDPGKIRFIGGGVDSAFLMPGKGMEEPSTLLQEIGVRTPYMMTVLGCEPRKNLSGLLAAYRMLPDGLQKKYALVVVGCYSDASRQAQLRQAGLSKKQKEQIIFVEDISDALLATLYRQADLFIFPSLNEGFGLPVAEAMACGCPVITSNTSSLPEILDWVPSTFDPYDAGGMAEKIAQALQDMAFRKELLDIAARKAGEHTWDKVASRSLAAIDEVLVQKSVKPVIHSVRKRIAFIGPLPPIKSGIADYNHRVIPELEMLCDLDVFVPDTASLLTQKSYRNARVFLLESLGRTFSAASYDLLLYSLGNSEHHIPTLRAIEKMPGVLWLHDVRLFGLFLAHAHRGRTLPDATRYIRSFFGRHYADRLSELQPKDQDLLDVMWYVENKLGMTRTLLNRARAVVLHSQHAEDILREEQVEAKCLPPVFRFPLACPDFDEGTHELSRKPIQLSTFGLVSPVKAPDVLIAAFALLKKDYPDLILNFVGAIDAPQKTELRAFIKEKGLCSADVVFTGYVADEAYRDWLQKTDIAILFRRSTNGESSAAGNDCLAGGLPLVTNLPTHQEYPDDVLMSLPFSATSLDLADALSTLISSPPLREKMHRAALNYAGQTDFRSVAQRILRLCEQVPDLTIDQSAFCVEVQAETLTPSSLILPPKNSDNDQLRLLLAGTPRSGNTWLRRLIMSMYGLTELAAHSPQKVDWDALPERCILQLHWLPEASFLAQLNQYGFRVLVLARHPLDVLLSMLRFVKNKAETFHWLAGLGGTEASIIEVCPGSDAFLEYALSSRFEALLAVTKDWWKEEHVMHARYEDLLKEPCATLGIISSALDQKPIMTAEEAVEMHTMASINKIWNNDHCWMGRSGNWKKFLPKKAAGSIAEKYAEAFSMLGYVCDPDPELSYEVAKENWEKWA